MAAGNTAGESIFQALCELVERYSARTVFFDKLTPPAIPEALFYLELSDIDKVLP